MNKEADKEWITEAPTTPEVEKTGSLLEHIQQGVFEIIEDLSLTYVQRMDQTLLGDLTLDSLRMVMLLVTLEDTFEIELDESDMNPFALVTVHDVVNLVSRYLTPDKEEVYDE